MPFLSSGATVGPSFGPNSWNGTSSYLNDVFRQGTTSVVPKSAPNSGVLTPEVLRFNDGANRFVSRDL
jgi:hypothetical protein